MPRPHWITDEVIGTEQMVLGSRATAEASCEGPKLISKGKNAKGIICWGRSCFQGVLRVISQLNTPQSLERHGHIACDIILKTYFDLPLIQSCQTFQTVRPNLDNGMEWWQLLWLSVEASETSESRQTWLQRHLILLLMDKLVIFLIHPIHQSCLWRLHPAVTASTGH